MRLLSIFCIPKCRTVFLFFPLYIPAACFIFWFLRNDFFISSQIYMNENWDKAWNVILWKTVLFHDKLKSYFLVYILNSIIRNYKNIHLFKVFLVSMQYRWKPLWFCFFVGFFDHKHLVSCWCTFENMFVCQIRDSEVWFAKQLGRHFLSDMIFFSWERLADTIFHKNRTTVKYQRKRNME